VRKPKPEISTVDVFVLYLLRDGASSLYGLHQSGLSIGAVSPALRRLEKSGLVAKEGKTEPRRRQKHRLTSKGQQFLRDRITGWEKATVSIPNDVESIARLVAIFHGEEDYEAAARIVSEALRQRRGKTAPSAARPNDPGIPGLYGWLLSVLGSARIQAETEALQAIATFLKRPARAD
jgi:DNA-binding PadR family transcriptional regulator